MNVNGVKVAELGSGETTVADARIGANVIKLQKFGYLAKLVTAIGLSGFRAMTETIL